MVGVGSGGDAAAAAAWRRGAEEIRVLVGAITLRALARVEIDDAAVERLIAVGGGGDAAAAAAWRRGAEEIGVPEGDSSSVRDGAATWYEAAAARRSGATESSRATARR